MSTTLVQNNQYIRNINRKFYLFKGVVALTQVILPFFIRLWKKNVILTRLDNR